MRLLFFTDSHIRTASMRSRLDSIQDALEDKFREVAEIARTCEVDAILHGGDLFDRPDVSVLTVTRFAGIFSEFPAPLYIIAGNHDIYAHNPKTLPRTMLGLLSALDVLHLIEDEGVVLENDCKVQLSAAPFRYDIDRGERNSYLVKRSAPDVDWHLLMVHGMLLPKPFLADISHTVISDLPELDADIVLAGHYHNGFEPVESKGTLFLNPGSLLRTSNSKIDMQRTPQVLLLDLKKDGQKEFRMIPLRSAKPGEEVLSRADLTEHQMRQENLEQFKLLVREHVDLERYDIYQMLEEIAKQEDFAQDIVKDAVHRLSQTEATDGEED